MKACVELGIEECVSCRSYKDKYHECIIDLYKKVMMGMNSSGEIKHYIIERITINKNHTYIISYIRAAANSVDPKYSLFIDKVLLLI